MSARIVRADGRQGSLGMGVMGADNNTPMTVDEARKLLAPYADGLLEPEMAQEVEAVMARVPELQNEFNTLREENALITEALAPLRPSQSTRVRVSELMQDACQRSAEEDKALADSKWRIMKITIVVIVLGMCLILGAALLFKFFQEHPPKIPPKKPPVTQPVNSEVPKPSGKPVEDLD
jgi:anti-sigma-K factor RskA